MSKSIYNYADSIMSATSTTPAIMQEPQCTQLLNIVFDKENNNIEQFQNQEFHSIFWYDIPEGKSQFSVNETRQLIQDIALKPYSGKHIFILRNFDTASIEAQNALLKTIEECPEYAVIIILVQSTQKILSTILSRVFLFEQNNETQNLNPEIEQLLDDFLQKKSQKWLGYMYENDFSREEVSLILRKVFSRLSQHNQKRCQEYIEALHSTNEKPKNILEIFFLGEEF